MLPIVLPIVEKDGQGDTYMLTCAGFFEAYVTKGAATTDGGLNVGLFDTTPLNCQYMGEFDKDAVRALYAILKNILEDDA